MSDRPNVTDLSDNMNFIRLPSVKDGQVMARERHGRN